MEADDDEKMGKRQRRMDKERKPPTLAGRLRKTPCRCCVRGGWQCLAQVGGWACVSCAKSKMRCVDAQEGDAPQVTAPIKPHSQTQPAPASTATPAPVPVPGPSRPQLRKNIVRSPTIVVSSYEEEDVLPPSFHHLNRENHTSMIYDLVFLCLLTL